MGFKYLLVISSGVSNLSLSFFFDYTSSQFLGVLLIMVGSVLIFSLLYMADEIIRGKGFIWVVFLFVLSMMFLMTSGDWMILILGWDWLGMSSFFLVAFYNSDSSWSGSFKTYFTNRLGDGLFLLILSLFVFESQMFNLAGNFMIIFLIILLTQTKSAQLPFSAWLPAAMAAPTPVSALVHSSTLVTAGMYILIRLLPSLSLINKYLCFIGLLTLFMGSISACGSSDMKKVVAFSTLSHLGFMVVCLSSGLSILAFFHLVVHASFKALLFICVGSLIVLNNHSQDLRQVSWNTKNLFYIWGSIISVISLCGFPYFSGFFSKDFIIEFFFWKFNIFFFFLFLSSLILSVLYSGRLIQSFLKVNWVVSDFSYNSFYMWYYIPLLLFSVSLGLMKSSFCLQFYLISGTYLLKVGMYLMLTLGCIVLLYQNTFFPFLASSMSLLDSLGPLVSLSSSTFSYSHQVLDLGVLPFLSESSFSKFLTLDNFFWNSLGSNLFYLSFMMGLIFVLM